MQEPQKLARFIQAGATAHVVALAIGSLTFAGVIDMTLALILLIVAWIVCIASSIPSFFTAGHLQP